MTAIKGRNHYLDPWEKRWILLALYDVSEANPEAFGDEAEFYVYRRLFEKLGGNAALAKAQCMEPWYHDIPSRKEGGTALTARPSDPRASAETTSHPPDESPEK